MDPQPMPLDKAGLKEAALHRLATLRSAGELTAAHQQMVADVLGVSARTIRRWLADTEDDGQLRKRPARGFVIDDELLVLLAYHRGNAASLRRDLQEQGRPVPSLATIERAVRRDVPPGDRAGLRHGERARRKHDVYLRRPPTVRNAAWEADHVQAPVEIDVDGRLVKPWVTWFVDATYNAIAGTAVTGGYPSREPIVAALRAAILRRNPYGPVGGLPQAVRVDQGKDFLSRTVTSAMAVFAVRVDDLPGYRPYLKGTVEAVNGAFASMLCAQLPRYTGAQKLINNAPADPDAPALTFEAFTQRVLGWVRWWNTEHTMPVLGGRTPEQAWLEDPTPITDVPEHLLRLYTLEDDGRVRHITTDGVSWKGRDYVADWMVGRGGDPVRLRWMPHHERDIEVFDAVTGASLGAAVVSNEATGKEAAALRRARDSKARQLKALYQTAEKQRRARYAAATVAGPPTPVEAITTADVEAEMADADEQDLVGTARPDLFGLPDPLAGWVMPLDPSRAEDRPAAGKPAPKGKKNKRSGGTARKEAGS